MKTRFVLLLVLAFATAGAANAVTSISLDFNGAGNTLAATGFGGVYNIDPAKFSVGGGNLSITTVPGDMFGQYDSHPDSAVNVFYSMIDPLWRTVLDAKVVMANVNTNYHGGGIWLGVDQDHYVRLGVINHSWSGGIVVEALRENQDLWPVRGGPGGDIIQGLSPKLANSGETVTAYLRIIREGSNATTWYSLDGVNYNQVGGVFDAVATYKTSQWFVEDGFRVGAYAYGGDFMCSPAIANFDYLYAVSTVPEPGSLFALASGLIGLIGLRARRRG